MERKVEGSKKSRKILSDSTVKTDAKNWVCIIIISKTTQGLLENGLTLALLPTSGMQIGLILPDKTVFNSRLKDFGIISATQQVPNISLVKFYNYANMLNL